MQVATKKLWKMLLLVKGSLMEACERKEKSELKACFYILHIYSMIVRGGLMWNASKAFAKCPCAPRGRGTETCLTGSELTDMLFATCACTPYVCRINAFPCDVPKKCPSCREQVGQGLLCLFEGIHFTELCHKQCDTRFPGTRWIFSPMTVYHQGLSSCSLQNISLGITTDVGLDHT